MGSCVDPSPPAPGALDTEIGDDFSNGRVRTAFALDDGQFYAAPPPADSSPRIPASVAFCTMLAGLLANGATVLSGAADHGLSFGLALVSVADSLPAAGPSTASTADTGDSFNPPGHYGARLAWIAVMETDVIASCPTRSPSSGPVPPASPLLPSYQILVIDAGSGADGIVYSARTNNVCGFPGYQSGGAIPARMSVSVPWTLVSRGPGPKSATISYMRRSCDQPIPANFQLPGHPRVPAVLTDRFRPGLVDVVVVRSLTFCGPAVATRILLRGATLATNLPTALVHAGVGALDVVDR